MQQKIYVLRHAVLCNASSHLQSITTPSSLFHLYIFHWTLLRLSSRTDEKLRAFTKFNDTRELLGFPVSLSAVAQASKKRLREPKGSVPTGIVVLCQCIVMGKRSQNRLLIHHLDSEKVRRGSWYGLTWIRRRSLRFKTSYRKRCLFQLQAKNMKGSCADEKCLQHVEKSYSAKTSSLARLRLLVKALHLLLNRHRVVALLVPAFQTREQSLSSSNEEFQTKYNETRMSWIWTELPRYIVNVQYWKLLKTI